MKKWFDRNIKPSADKLDDLLTNGFSVSEKNIKKNPHMIADLEREYIRREVLGVGRKVNSFASPSKDPTLEEEMKESEDMVDFVRLAEKYRHHDGEDCPATDCLVCEGIGWIVNGQSDIADAHYERNRDYALDNGMVF